MDDATRQDTTLNEQQEPLDEFEVELSDLPPSTRSHYWLIRLVALKKRLLGIIHKKESAQAEAARSTPAFARRATRARIGQTLTTLGTCATLLILLLGNNPGLRNQLAGLLLPPAATPTSVANTNATFSSVQIIAIQSTLTTHRVGHDTSNSFGPLPATCPQASALQHFLTSIDPPGLGGGPLWITGFNGPVAILRDLIPRPPDASLPSGVGKNYWYTTLTLFIQKGYEGSIVLQGGEQNSGETLLFSDPNLLKIHFAAYINLQDPTIHQHLLANGPWEMLSVQIYLPTAGCYYLQANWSTDTWIAYFAAGN